MKRQRKIRGTYDERLGFQEMAFDIILLWVGEGKALEKSWDTALSMQAVQNLSPRCRSKQGN